jgi:hypothetical protein
MITPGRRFPQTDLKASSFYDFGARDLQGGYLLNYQIHRVMQKALPEKGMPELSNLIPADSCRNPAWY